VSDEWDGAGADVRVSNGFREESVEGATSSEKALWQDVPSSDEDGPSAPIRDDACRKGEQGWERKRTESRRAFLLKLLSVADNLKRALEYARPDDGLSEGVRLTYRELLDILRTEGVEPIESIGLPFDPSVHEAVGVASGYPFEGIVVKEETKGYWHDGELLRPSQVVVSS
jgi:molecular chaperone GrpE